MSFYSVIFAAGSDGRMKSKTPKPLMRVAERPMLSWVMKAAEEAGAKKCVAIADSACTERIKALCGEAAEVIESSEVMQVIKEIGAEDGTVMIIGADMPLIESETLKNALAEHKKAKRAATVIASGDESCGKVLIAELKALKAASDIDEVIEAAAEYGADGDELLLVCDRAGLARAEKAFNRRNIERAMADGVSIIDPDNTYIGAEVKIGMDTVILPGTHISGKTVIGETCEIGPNSMIESCEIGNNTSVISSKLVESTVGNNVNIGPFAYLRPNSRISDNVKIGDFVEIKNANIDEGTKVAHLTYIGDADVGKRVNFGCGTVVVNYDGKKKHRTTIGDDAFIGCNTNLVSPVTVRDGAYTAAGSTITSEVPENSLAIARARQVNKENWVKENNKLK